MAMVRPRFDSLDVFNAKTFNFVLWGMLIGIYLVNALPVIEWVLSQDTLSLPAVLLGAFGCMIVAGIIFLFGFPTKRLSTEAVILVVICAGLSHFTFSIFHQLSTAFILLGFYGFAAGFERITPRLWRQGIVLASLAALVLPFAIARGTGLGFYLRLLTADTAAQVLSWLGFTSMGAHDVLIFDNGIAQVDAPCSGLKSLFTGTAFYLVASLMFRRVISFKWVGLYSLFIGLLLIANTLRVILLIYMSEIANQHDLAEAIHVPLGLILFSLCCVVALWGMKYIPSYRQTSGPRTRTLPFWGWAVALVFLLAMSVIRGTEVTAFTPHLSPPTDLSLKPIELTPTETGFFKARENTQASKWMFEYQGLSGSMLVVQSRAANGLHAPEICFLGNGISVNTMRSISSQGQTYRWLSVDESRKSAMYWMQSGTDVTDDFRVRLSRFLFGGKRDWTLVTILLDARHNPDEDRVQDLRETLISHYQTERTN